MSAIGPGDIVECVDGSPHSGTPSAKLVLGSVYTVQKLSEREQVLLKEVQPIATNGLPVVWAVERFRPLKRRDEQLLRDLLEPLPADLEPADA